MYELIQVADATYYIESPLKIGVYRVNEQDVLLIDSGGDKQTAKRIQKILTERDWNLKFIINTHSHADHIGGNSFLQQRYQCPAYSVGIDNAFIRSPILEPSLLYGGCPPKELRKKFLLAQPSEVFELTPDVLPQGFEVVRLDGHSFAMAGVRTPDGVWFLADSLTNAEIMEKHHISFLYDVGAYLEALDAVSGLRGKLFIPAHAEPTGDIKPLAELNRSKVYEIMEALKETCAEPLCFEEVLKEMFDRYHLLMNITQYALVGSTIRSYLAYLHDKGEMNALVRENRLLWQTAL